MKGVYVKRNPVIKLSLTADDWQLYEGEDYPYRENVAEVLNRGIENALNASDTSKKEKIKKCQHLLYSHRRYGASDTEGYAVLDTILSEFYGEAYYLGEVA